jgi:D-alanyl-D-alanine carboxypeptidase/D-alanyl-D-alanine-endopeptidase (penicillin-binding protein 4)
MARPHGGHPTLLRPATDLVALLLLWLVFLPMPPAAAAAHGLPAPVARALASAGISAANVGAVVQEVGARRPRLALNAARPMNPASVMKLVTTYAALELLGPAHTWRTEVYAVGKPAQGVVAGDIYLKGSGDPKLSFEQFWLLLRQLRARGVQDIRGDLVLDSTRFAPARHDPGAFDGEPYAAYNVGADALLLNFKAVRLRLIPDAGSGDPAVLAEPEPAGLDIRSQVRRSDGPCGEWKDGIAANLTHQDRRAQLTLTGSFATACGEKILSLGVLDHAEYVLGVFRQLWRELGGTLAGGVRDGMLPPDAEYLAAIDSPPLAEVVRDINKFSNNVMARQLLLTLGAEQGRRPAGEADGVAAIRAWLAAKDLPMPELSMENGAGLSRTDRIGAASLARLLQAAYRSAVMPEFISSLPLLAVDGTMKKHLNGSTVAGRAHIKTGTLSGVKTLAGYVLDRTGRRWVVVFLVNDPAAAGAGAAQDALLQWIHDRGR